MRTRATIATHAQLQSTVPRRVLDQYNVAVLRRAHATLATAQAKRSVVAAGGGAERQRNRLQPVTSHPPWYRTHMQWDLDRLILDPRRVLHPQPIGRKVMGATHISHHNVGAILTKWCDVMILWFQTGRWSASGAGASTARGRGPPSSASLPRTGRHRPRTAQSTCPALLGLPVPQGPF